MAYNTVRENDSDNHGRRHGGCVGRGSRGRRGHGRDGRGRDERSYQGGRGAPAN